MSCLHETFIENHAQQLDISMVDSICIVYAYSCVRGVIWRRLQHMQITIFV